MSFLSKTIVGLDISDNSIEVVRISISGNKRRITYSGRVSLMQGVVQGGRILNPDLLKKALISVFSATKKDRVDAKNIVFGIPEALVFNHLYSHLVINNESNLEEVIEKEARQSIPLTKNDLIFSYKNFSREQNEVSGVITAVSKKDLIEWQDFFKSINFEVEVYEPKTNALLRSLDSQDKKYPLCIVDIGSSATHISIFNSLGMVFNNSILVGGQNILEGISKDLSIDDNDEVQRMAFNEGLSNPGSKLCSCIINVIDDIAREINTSISYTENRSGKQVEKVLITGGTTLIPGMVDYFATNINKEVIPAKLNLTGIRAQEKKIMYLKAAGLALRLSSESWKSDTYFKKKISDKKSIEVKKEEPQYTLNEKKEKTYTNNQSQEKSFFGNIKKYDKEILLILLMIALLALLIFAFKDSENKVQNAVIPPEIQALLDNLPKEKEPSVKEIEEQTTSTEALNEQEDVSRKTLKILNTPTGWLNVRSGPGTENEIVGKVYPQEIYKFLDIEKEWYIIRLSDETDGWVISDYVQEIPEDN